MKKIIKAETDRHIKALEKLAKKIWNEHYVPIIGQEQVDYMLEKFQSFNSIKAQSESGYDYYLFYADDQLSGYFALRSEEKLFISKLYISSELRGCGYGIYLLNYIKELAVINNISTLWLTANRFNIHSLNWYKKRGFQIMKEVKQDIGRGYFMDDYVLEMELNKLKTEVK